MSNFECVLFKVPFDMKREIHHVSIQITFVVHKKSSFSPPNRCQCCTASARVGWNFGMVRGTHGSNRYPCIGVNGLPMMTLCWIVPLPRMTVTTRIIPFLGSGSQPKPSFATVTGRGDNPNFVKQTCQCHIPKITSNSSWLCNPK